MIVKKLVSMVTVTTVILCSGVSLVAAPQFPRYVVINLGIVDITNGGAKDINESGQVALNLDGIAFIYDDGILSPPGGVFNNNTSFAINDYAHLTWTQNLNAAYWNGTSVNIIPGTFDAWDINNLDHITGKTKSGQAYLWDGQQTIVLPSISSGGGGYAVNDSDVVVGESGNLPVRWSNGMVEPLPLPPGTDRGQAWDINENNHIVGLVSAGNQVLDSRAALWTQSGVTELGDLNGRDYTRAWGINSVGDIVGEARFSISGNSRAFLYRNGTMLDLTDLVSPTDWILEQAFSINTAGEIVGVGRFNGEDTAFLLVPVPEPGCLFLLFVCTITCLGARRLILN
jgi:probable HAF family extracellular repeat protein